MTRMTPELPDPALHSRDLSPELVKKGTAAQDTIASRAAVPKKSGLVA
jgi:hypothetical protein